ncbi:hypothetical protein ASD54_25495 [Rhizobium sp. Root149]|nr:hypothetical protein ASD54_25495 [Rhizobium sp. Root149]
MGTPGLRASALWDSFVAAAKSWAIAQPVADVAKIIDIALTQLATEYSFKRSVRLLRNNRSSISISDTRKDGLVL